MTKEMRVGLIIQAYDRASSVVKKLRGNFDAAAKSMMDGAEKATKTWEKAGNLRNAAEGLSRVGKTLRAGLIESTDVFADFEHTMLQVRANADDLSDEGFLTLTDRAKELGATTRFSAQEAAEGMLNLSKAGFNTRDTMAAISPVLNLAAAESMDLGRAAEITAGVMSTFGLQAKDVGYITDILSKTASSSTTDVSDLGESIKYAGGQARALGVTLPQTAGLLTALATNSIKGSQAGTGLAGVFRGLTGANRTGAKYLKALGLSTKDAAGGLRPITDILADLNEKTAKMGAVARSKVLTKLFGSEAVPAALALMDQAAKGALPEFIRQVAEAEGEVLRKKAITDKGVKQSNDELSSSYEGLQIQIGQYTSEIMGPLKTALTETLGSVTQWAKEHPTLTKAIIGTTLAVSALATALSGILFTAVTLVGISGMSSLVGGMGGAVKIMFGMQTQAAATAGSMTSLATAQGAAAATAATLLGTLSAIVAVAGAVAVAISEIIKHKESLDEWDDWKEGFKGIRDQFMGSNTDVPWMMDPSAGASGVISELFNPATIVNEGLDESPIAAANTKQFVEGHVGIGISVDGPGRVSRTSTRGPVSLDPVGRNMSGL